MIVFLVTIKGINCGGGRKGGMPEMVFEYILKKNGLTPQKDVTIIQNIDLVLQLQLSHLTHL